MDGENGFPDLIFQRHYSQIAIFSIRFLRFLCNAALKADPVCCGLYLLEQTVNTSNNLQQAGLLGSGQCKATRGCHIIRNTQNRANSFRIER